MDYLTFREKMHPQGCFNVNQILLWEKDFDRNNLTRWCKKNLLVKLRNEYYTFPDYLNVPDFARYIANRIYRPSYISMHTALSFYGMIPEEVVQFTCVTTNKTALFENQFGTYKYHKIRNEYFFGYEPKLMQNGRALLLATPEKALLDFFYLNPYYQTEQDMLELRLDEDFMQCELDNDKLASYLARMNHKTLNHKVECLLKVYQS